MFVFRGVSSGTRVFLSEGKGGFSYKEIRGACRTFKGQKTRFVTSYGIQEIICCFRQFWYLIDLLGVKNISSDALKTESWYLSGEY